MLLLVVLSLNCVTTGVHGAWTALGAATPFVGQPRTADQGPPVQKPPSLACARARRGCQRTCLFCLNQCLLALSMEKVAHTHTHTHTHTHHTFSVSPTTTSRWQAFRGVDFFHLSRAGKNRRTNKSTKKKPLYFLVLV